MFRFLYVHLLKFTRVLFSTGALQGFIDRVGTLGHRTATAFVKAHADAVARYVEHCSDVFDEQTVRQVVAWAEEQFVIRHIMAIQDAEQGRLTDRIPLSRENIG